MRVLLLLIIPLLLQSRSIVRERNDVIKQALIPTLVNIIGHARMEEHGKLPHLFVMNNISRNW